MICFADWHPVCLVSDQFAIHIKTRRNGMAEDTKVQSTLSMDSLDDENPFEECEPWSPVETKLVLGSFATAGICLVLFGYLINKFILS